MNNLGDTISKTGLNLEMKKVDRYYEYNYVTDVRW